ncbi:MAG TPA: c-type cytochrome [Gemmatimonadaceae bacterium]|nr:c-type cytochrome [Gemmatimonadaceae bacterium]
MTARASSWWFAPTVAVALGVAACRADREPAASARGSGGSTSAAGQYAVGRGGAGHFDAAAWKAPPDSAIPNDSLGAAIRRGLALVTHTGDSLPRYAPGKITCSNCHLDAGRNPDAAPFAGAAARFPKYMDRTGAVIGLADRVNYCFTRSLAGSKLPVDSREMQDILAYITWLSSGVPVGEGKKLPGAEGLHAMAATLESDTARGGEVFRAKCVTCHGVDGQGNPGFPALWGPRSFSVGASMARRGKAASFIWHNMPFGQGRSLTPQQAFDVAAYIDSRPRPDSPGKEHDWPTGGAPADVPYATAGHAAYLPPPTIPRQRAAEAIVARPAPVARGGATRRGEAP